MRLSSVSPIAALARERSLGCQPPHVYQIGKRQRGHLFHDVMTMRFDQTVARSQYPGDLTVGLAADQQIEHLTLLRSQRAQPAQYIVARLVFQSLAPVAIDRRTDAGQQEGVVDGLLDEI